MLHLPHAGLPGAAAASQVTPATVEAFVELESSNFRTTFVTGRVTVESSSSEQDVLASDGEHRLILQMQPRFSGKKPYTRRKPIRPVAAHQDIAVPPSIYRRIAASAEGIGVWLPGGHVGNRQPTSQ